VAKSVDATDLKLFEHAGGKPPREWSQSRRTLNSKADGNAELRPVQFPAKCRDETAPS
jgi:hypothetical protein